MSADDVQTIAAWHYPDPYSFYDLTADPDDLAEFLDLDDWEPDSHFGVWDPDGSLVGFFAFEHQEPTVIEVGLGLRPDRTGHGHGRLFVRTGLRFAREHFHPERFTLAVAAFNRRAVTLYRSLGFTEAGRFVQRTNGGEYDFIRMTLSASDV